MTCSSSHSIDFAGVGIDPLKRPRQIGEHYVVNPLNMQQETDDNYIFNMSTDKFEHVSMRLAIDHCGRFGPGDDAAMHGCYQEHPGCMDVFRDSRTGQPATKIERLGSAFSATRGAGDVTEYALAAAELAWKRIQSHSKREVTCQVETQDYDGDDHEQVLRNKPGPEEALADVKREFIKRYLETKLTRENMHALVDHGIALPFATIMLRPFMTYMCGTCILAKGGPELGNSESSAARYRCCLHAARVLTTRLRLSRPDSLSWPSRFPARGRHVRAPCSRARSRARSRVRRC